jgi:pimeloyl-ACP methyl ester carboxylesterase
MNKKELSINGHVTRYWSSHDDKLPVIIMVHGFRGTHHGLDKIVKNLPRFRVIVPDLPGFGETQPYKKHSVEDYVTWLEQFIAKLGLSEQPILLGHSFGSIIASHFAAVHPQTIQKLILVNPIGYPALKGPQAILTQGAILYYWFGRKLPGKYSKHWLSSPLFVDTMSRVMTKSKDKKMKEFVKEQHRQYFSSFVSSTVVAQSFRASVSHDVREVAPSLTVPTLLVAGEQDDITSVDKQKELHKLIKGSDLHIIPNVGHLIHYETAGSAAQIIQDWITAPART